MNTEYIVLNRNNFYINYQKENNMTWKAICFSLCLHLSIKLQHMKRRETKWPINQRENEMSNQTWPMKNILDTIVETLYRMYEQMWNVSEDLKTVNNT